MQRVEDKALRPAQTHGYYELFLKDLRLRLYEVRSGSHMPELKTGRLRPFCIAEPTRSCNNMTTRGPD